MSLPALPHAIAGVDGCRGGWVAVLRLPDGTFAARVFARLACLIAALDENAVLAVDMPIGLPERIGAGGRGPEALLRAFLGPRRSSVFSIPSRAAIYAAPGPFVDRAARAGGFALACRVARETSDPLAAFSVQAFGLFPKIRELDGLLREHATLLPRLFESHPEAAFAYLNGGRPMRWPKKQSAGPATGLAERRDLLLAHGLPAALLAQRLPGAGADDLLDAAALLFPAARFAKGEARSFPDPPGCDAFGLPIAIWI